MKPSTVKPGNKEWFDKELIGIKKLHKDKEHLALRKNFRATRKFLIAKFDFTKKAMEAYLINIIYHQKKFDFDDFFR